MASISLMLLLLAQLTQTEMPVDDIDISTVDAQCRVWCESNPLRPALGRPPRGEQPADYRSENFYPSIDKTRGRNIRSLAVSS